MVELLFKIDEELKNKSGIYKIVNLVNNKIYVGSAVNLNDRFRTHKSDLKSNKHCNEYLQNSWNKHGEKNFIFDIIEFVENKNKLIEKEQYWIDKLNVCKRKYGYNICSQAGSTLGTKATDDTVYKLKYENPKSKKIVQCDLNGNFLKIWVSSRDIDRKMNYNSSSIIKCCKHKVSYAYGFLWFYQEEYNNVNFKIKDYIDSAKNNNTFKTRDFKVQQFLKNGQLLRVWNNIKEASGELNILEKGILRCCENNEKFHTYKGFIWKLVIESGEFKELLNSSPSFISKDELRKYKVVG